MSRLEELAALGQAIWYDDIRRSYLEPGGELDRLIGLGVRGVTSNPTIFEKAIAGSSDYDRDLERLAARGAGVEEIYEALVLDDIGRAADRFLPVHERTGGQDGYVSLEVSPTLARDTAGTVAEARRLYAALGRPNVMIKVPATPEGIPAVETLIAEGVNVNVTLIFSLAQYDAVAGAYQNGIARRLIAGGDAAGVASVASFFVSRVDAAVDPALAGVGAEDLLGTVAVDNAVVAYARFLELFRGEPWNRLARAGARVQRPLWASTGTKNPDYPDTLYVDRLIGPDTVNTVPPATLRAFLDHGGVARTIDRDPEGARVRLARLEGLGVDLDAVTRKLQDDGVAAFAKSFTDLMGAIAAKRERFAAA